MAAAEFRSEPLGPQHDRATFSCGVEALDRYLRQQASQDIRNKLAAVFVLVHLPSSQIAGFYTLSAYGIEARALPPDLLRRLPRYPLLPAILLGRLAVDQHFRGQGVGQLLLYAALRRCLALSTDLGALAVVVDAKNDAAKAFYERHSFVQLTDQPQRLFLPMRLIEQMNH